MGSWQVRNPADTKCCLSFVTMTIPKDVTNVFELMGSWQVGNPTYITNCLSQLWEFEMTLSKTKVQYISIYFQAVRKVLTIEAKGEGEEVSLEIFILLWSCRSQYFSCQDLWSRDCEQDCQGIHGVLHYTVHATEKEFRLKARDGKEIWIKIHGCIFCFVQT